MHVEYTKRIFVFYCTFSNLLQKERKVCVLRFLKCQIYRINLRYLKGLGVNRCAKMKFLSLIFFKFPKKHMYKFISSIGYKFSRNAVNQEYLTEKSMY